MSDLSAFVEALRPRRTALAALWEACTVECPDCYAKGALVWTGRPYLSANDTRVIPCPYCAKGRVPRDVEGWPAGAVAGMLGYWAEKHWLPTCLSLPDNHAWWYALDHIRQAVESLNDAAALAAVLEAVRAVPEDGDAAGETT